ncbi:hypothetical protein RD792_004008 [Penstemon davidsonii]|uniref:Uncharacterized protein n=1 Tax=Penstemon davidsonii TaxID=160366 RepID=A0ABR0DHE5_9LAMI|nr:hypothetical protein RD792_004008 [Penstemon davidsonii]
MKSLVIHSNGCTVFDSNGQVVFRVDNYQKTSSNEVFLMNSNGQVLFSIKTKNVLMFRNWEGYKWTNSKFCKEDDQLFKVTRKCKVFGREITSFVIQECNGVAGNCYKIVGLEGKSTLKIIDFSGRILAEVKLVIQKQSLGGVSLGDDVLSLTVEPQTDQTLIMALVLVHGMINRKL